MKIVFRCSPTTAPKMHCLRLCILSVMSNINPFLSTDVQDVHGATVRGPGCRGDEVRCRGDFLPDSAASASKPETDITADPVPDRPRPQQSERRGPVHLILLPHGLPLCTANTAHYHGNHHRDDSHHRSEGRQCVGVKPASTVVRWRAQAAFGWLVTW